MAKITLFAQVIQKLPKDLIKSLVRKHGTDKHAKGFNTWSHLVSMIFCQFADCVSLREISNGLHSANGNLFRTAGWVFRPQVPLQKRSLCLTLRPKGREKKGDEGYQHT